MNQQSKQQLSSEASDSMVLTESLTRIQEQAVSEPAKVPTNVSKKQYLKYFQGQTQLFQSISE